MLNNRFNNEQGAVLIITLILLSVSIIFITTMNRIVYNNSHRFTKDQKYEQARQLAQSGIDKALVELETGELKIGEIEKNNLGSGFYQTSVQLAGNGYVIINSTGQVADVTKNLTVKRKLNRKLIDYNNFSVFNNLVASASGESQESKYPIEFNQEDDDYYPLTGFYYQGDAYEELTLVAKIKTTDDRGIIYSFDGNQYFSFGIGSDKNNSSGKLTFNLSGDSGIIEQLIWSKSNIKVNDGKEHIIAAKFNNNKVTLYIDGQKQEYKNIKFNSFGSNLSRYGIVGADAKRNSFDNIENINDYFDGTIKWIQHWHRALSDQEIELYSNPALIDNKSKLVNLYYRSANWDQVINLNESTKVIDLKELVKRKNQFDTDTPKGQWKYDKKNKDLSSIKAQNGTSGLISPNGYEQSNYKIEFELKPNNWASNPTEFIGFAFRFQDKNNYYYFKLNPYRYDPRVFIYKIVDGESSIPLANHQFKDRFDDRYGDSIIDNWQKIKIEVQDSNMKVYFHYDDVDEPELVLEATDNDLKTGSYGPIDRRLADNQFRNIKVTTNGSATGSLKIVNDKDAKNKYALELKERQHYYKDDLYHYGENAIYKIEARVKQEEDATNNNGQSFYLGVEGLDDEGKLVNILGEDSHQNQHYILLDDVQFQSEEGWKTVVAYFSGQTKDETKINERKNQAIILNKIPLRSEVDYFRPVFIANNDGNGAARIDYFKIKKLDITTN